MSADSSTGPATERDVVVIGGGTGSFGVLSGLREYRRLRLHSVVTMMDSGGDSGRLRDEYGVLPPGDLRRCVVALAEESQVLRDLFQYRFDEASLEGRSLGNLFFLAATKTLGSEKAAVDAIVRLLNVRGSVRPVTWDHTHLCAELEDGTVVRGEASIGIDAGPARAAIRRVYLDRPATACEDALAAVAGADAIVLAPGDLYTSTIANFLVSGLSEAVQAARAPLVYVMNLMTRYGETHGYDASHHVAELVRYVGRVPDAVVTHAGRVPDALAERYLAEHAAPVVIDTGELERLGVARVKAADVMSASSLVRHDATRTAAALVALLDELWSRA